MNRSVRIAFLIIIVSFLLTACSQTPSSMPAEKQPTAKTEVSSVAKQEVAVKKEASSAAGVKPEISEKKAEEPKQTESVNLKDALPESFAEKVAKDCRERLAKYEPTPTEEELNLFYDFTYALASENSGDAAKLIKSQKWLALNEKYFKREENAKNFKVGWSGQELGYHFSYLSVERESSGTSNPRIDYSMRYTIERMAKEKRYAKGPAITISYLSWINATGWVIDNITVMNYTNAPTQEQIDNMKEKQILTFKPQLRSGKFNLSHDVTIYNSQSPGNKSEWNYYAEGSMKEGFLTGDLSRKIDWQETKLSLGDTYGHYEDTCTYDAAGVLQSIKTLNYDTNMKKSDGIYRIPVQPESWDTCLSFETVPSQERIRSEMQNPVMGVGFINHPSGAIAVP